MTTRERELYPLGPFPAGTNNVAPLTAPPTNDGRVLAARELVNVDVDAAGRVRRRRGTVTLYPQAAHSLFATHDYLFAWRDGSLGAYAEAGEGLELVSEILALPDRFVSMTSDDDDVYWSNGLEIGRITTALEARPVWVDTPNPVGLAVASAGGLAAGNYEVSVTVLDAEGRESGASAPAVLALSAGQGLAISLPSAPASAVSWRIYVSPPDGEVLYLAAERPIATTSVNVGAHTAGKALDTAWLFPMPPCTTLRYGHGRLLGLTGDALLWSEPYRLGLTHDGNHLGLSGGTLLEPVGEGSDGGWFLADHKRTYFMAGADPKAWRQVIRYPHPAVPGTSLTVPGSVFGLGIDAPVAFWLARNGVFCLGLPDGSVKPLREGELALPVEAERGTAAFFAFDGLRQIATSLVGGQNNPFGVSDSASATVRRHGLTLP